ncbi:hypothetical protein LMG6871_01872 [Ralstonia edaphis]|nr:hypothetical protein LMG6871_01872 [Ralstonia sp. LMG 6871]
MRVPVSPHDIEGEKTRLEIAAHERNIDGTVLTNNQFLFCERLKIGDGHRMKLVNRDPLFVQMPVLDKGQTVACIYDVRNQQIIGERLKNRRVFTRQRDGGC